MDSCAEGGSSKCRRGAIKKANHRMNIRPCPCGCPEAHFFIANNCSDPRRCEGKCRHAAVVLKSTPRSEIEQALQRLRLCGDGNILGVQHPGKVDHLEECFRRGMDQSLRSPDCTCSCHVCSEECYDYEMLRNPDTPLPYCFFLFAEPEVVVKMSDTTMRRMTVSSLASGGIEEDGSGTAVPLKTSSVTLSGVEFLGGDDWSSVDAKEVVQYDVSIRSNEQGHVFDDKLLIVNVRDASETDCNAAPNTAPKAAIVLCDVGGPCIGFPILPPHHEEERAKGSSDGAGMHRSSFDSAVGYMAFRSYYGKRPYHRTSQAQRDVVKQILKTWDAEADAVSKRFRKLSNKEMERLLRTAPAQSLVGRRIPQRPRMPPPDITAMVQLVCFRGMRQERVEEAGLYRTIAESFVGVGKVAQRAAKEGAYGKALDSLLELWYKSCDRLGMITA